MPDDEKGGAADEDKNIEIWKIKKLIKSLEAARGCVARDCPRRWRAELCLLQSRPGLRWEGRVRVRGSLRGCMHGLASPCQPPSMRASPTALCGACAATARR